MRKIGSILGGVVAIVVLIGVFTSQRHASTYNKYIDELRPIIEKQDKIVDELKKAPGDEVGKKVDGWIKRSVVLEAKFAAIKPKEEAVAQMHKLWVERAKSLTAALRALKAHTKSLADEDREAVKKHMKVAGDKLKQFETLRDAYFKKHNMKLKKKK